MADDEIDEIDEIIALDNTAEGGRENQKQRLEEIESRLTYEAGSELQQLSANTKLESNERCLNTRKLMFEGVTKIPDELLIEWKNRVKEADCFNIGLLATIIREVSNYYLSHGYITSQPLKPKQGEEGGVLIPVAEGRVANISAEGDSLPTALVYPNAQEGTFNMRDLEQAMEQINRLKTYDYTSELRPGEEYATSDIILSPTERHGEKHWHGYLSYNNINYPGTLSGKVGYDDPFGLLGAMSLSYSREWFTADRQSRSYSLSYGVPYGYSNFNFSHSLSTTFAEIPSQKVVGKLITRSTTSQRTKFEWSALQYRDKETTFSHYVSIGYSDLSNLTKFPGGVRYINEGSNELITNLDVGFRYRRLGNGQTFSFGIGYDFGLDGLGTRENKPQLIEGELHILPDAGYGMMHLDADYTKYFSNRLWTKNQLVAQFSDSYLPNHKRFSIGGYHSVRGAKSVAYSGNSGFYLRNTLSYRADTIALADQTIGNTLSIGLDAGQIFSSERYKERRLIGVNLGYSGVIGPASIKMDVGRTLANTAGANLDNWFWLGQFTWQF